MSVMEIDDKIVMEKLKRLVSMEPKILIHRILRKDLKANKLASKYKQRYLIIIKREENLK